MGQTEQSPFELNDRVAHVLESGADFGELDHVTWVTMKQAGPTIGHVLIDSVQTENLAPIRTFEPGVELSGIAPPPGDLAAAPPERQP